MHERHNPFKPYSLPARQYDEECRRRREGQKIIDDRSHQAHLDSLRAPSAPVSSRVGSATSSSTGGGEPASMIAVVIMIAFLVFAGLIAG